MYSKSIFRNLYLMLALHIVFFSLATIPANAASFGLSPTGKYFSFTEYAESGEKILTENGNLYGLEGTFQFPLSPTWRSTNQFLYLHGRSDYQGRTQLGSPHNTISNQEFFSLNSSLIYSMSEKLSAHTAIRYTKWNRAIQETSSVMSLSEKYFWYEVHLGMQYQVFNENRQILELYFSVFSTYKPQVSVNLETLNAGVQYLKLEPRTGYTGGISYKKHLQEKLSLGLKLIYKESEFGRSDGRLIQSNRGNLRILEPHSESRSLTFQVELSKRF